LAGQLDQPAAHITHHPPGLLEEVARNPHVFPGHGHASCAQPGIGHAGCRQLEPADDLLRWLLGDARVHGVVSRVHETRPARLAAGCPPRRGAVKFRTLARKASPAWLNGSGVSKLKPWLPPGTFTSFAFGMWRASRSELAGEISRSASPVMTRVGTAIWCSRSV